MSRAGQKILETGSGPRKPLFHDVHKSTTCFTGQLDMRYFTPVPPRLLPRLKQRHVFHAVFRMFSDTFRDFPPRFPQRFRHLAHDIFHHVFHQSFYQVQSTLQETFPRGFNVFHHVFLHVSPTMAANLSIAPNFPSHFQDIFHKFSTSFPQVSRVFPHGLLSIVCLN